MIKCLLELEIPDRKADGKMELVQITRQLMPEGRPAFLDVIKFPMIRDLVKQDERNMLKVMYLMVKDFCSSLNVVRNMNEDQMIEAAAMLLDECTNFRIEDYVMMFALAKRGDLVKIYDRVDLQVLSEVMDKYWDRRNNAAKKLDQEVQHLDGLGSTTRQLELLNPTEAKMVQTVDKLAAGFDAMRSGLKERLPDVSEQDALKQRMKNPNYNNPYSETKKPN